MRTARALLRLVTLVASTTLRYLIWAAGALVLRAFPARRRWWRGHCFRGWARRTVRLLGIDISWHGYPPAEPFLLVTNHLGYIDIVVLASELDAVFVAKSEVARWPVIGRLTRSMGTIFVDRRTPRGIPAIVTAIDEALAGGESVVLFPEGTSTAGATVEPFKAPLLAGAAAAGTPVACAAISYRTPPDEDPAHLAVCWWGNMTFLPHLWRLSRLRRFEAEVSFVIEPLRDPDRKRLARRLHEAVLDHFQPLVVPEKPCAIS